MFSVIFFVQFIGHLFDAYSVDTKKTFPRS